MVIRRNSGTVYYVIKTSKTTFIMEQTEAYFRQIKFRFMVKIVLVILCRNDKVSFGRETEEINFLIQSIKCGKLSSRYEILQALITLKNLFC